MAGSIFSKFSTTFTLASSMAIVSTGSAVSTTLNADFSSSGALNGNTRAFFELTGSFNVTTGLAKGVRVCEIYMVPSVDGTNFPDVDLTSGASVLPYESMTATMTFTKAPTVSTNVRFTSSKWENIVPLVYKPYILNKSGVSINSSFVLKIAVAQDQYT